MPEPGTVEQEEKEHKKQQMPERFEFSFHKKIHYQYFFKFPRTVFHLIRLINS
jgi:hypothetical protein